MRYRKVREWLDTAPSGDIEHLIYYALITRRIVVRDIIHVIDLYFKAKDLDKEEN